MPAKKRKKPAARKRAKRPAKKTAKRTPRKYVKLSSIDLPYVEQVAPVPDPINEDRRSPIWRVLQWMFPF